MDSINLIIAINKAYIEHCKNMLFSFFYNNPQKFVHVFLMTNSLSKQEVNDLSNFISQFNGKMEFISIDPNMLDGLPVSDRFSIEMYYRIFAFVLLPQDMERALWLDSDLIVTQSLDDFYFQTFDNFDIVACEDFYSDSVEIQEIKKNMKITSEHSYFNSGVLLFNLRKIRCDFTIESIISVIDEFKNQLIYPDQDLLNKIYQGKVKYANNIRYNFQVNLTMNVSIKKSNIHILHYTGNKKPWLPKYARPICRYYWCYRWKKGDYLEFIIFYISYFFLSIPKEIKRKKNPGY